MPGNNINSAIMDLETQNIAIKQELRNITSIEADVEQRITPTLIPVEHPVYGVLNEIAIDKRIQALAQQLVHSGIDNPLLIPVLDGALPFYGRLYHFLHTNHPTFRFQVSTVSASSYVGEQSSGKLDIHAEPKSPLGARNIVLIDDVLDTGSTLQTLAKTFEEEHGADNVACMVLIDKQQDWRVQNF